MERQRELMSFWKLLVGREVYELSQSEERITEDFHPLFSHFKRQIYSPYLS